MTPTQLYRHFDCNDRLLYVGISNDADNRLTQHLSRSPWRREFFRMTIEKFPTRGAAVDAEAAAILHEKPLYNKAGRAEPKEPDLDGDWELKKVNFWLEHGIPLLGQGRDRLRCN